MTSNRLGASALIAVFVAAAWAFPAAAQTTRAAAGPIKAMEGSPAEFKITLSSKSATVGTVTFAVMNKGNLPHDFKIAGKKTPLLSPGKSAKLTVKFSKAGKYPYQCSVSGHAAAGMKGVLTVK